MVSNESLAKFLIVVDQLEALSYLRINLLPSLDNNAVVFAKAFVTTPDVETKTSNNNLKVMELEAVMIMVLIMKLQQTTMDLKVYIWMKKKM